jgi:hypothetical protein
LPRIILCLELDSELDALLDQIQDEIEEQGEASAEAMERFQLFCQAMDVKIDRIGRFLRVMETRAEHCKKESARYAARAKRAQSKIERTESMVLYYLASHNLKKIESHEFTLKRNKNSQDSVVITQPDSIPDDLRRFEARIDGLLWLEVIGALPRRWQSRSQPLSNQANPRIVPLSSILPMVAWSTELRSNAGTICGSNNGKLNQTLAGSTGRRWRWPALVCS